MNRSKFYMPAMLASLLLFTGCVKIWQDTLDIRTYMITTERSGEMLAQPLGDKLWIDDVAVLPPYNVRNLIIRNDDVEFETSYYTELLMTPPENFRNEFYTWLHSSGVFQDVSLTSRTQRTHSLSVSVVEFYADVSSMEAVLSIKASLFDEKTKGLRVLMTKEYKQRIKIAEKDAPTLIRAYNEALKNTLKACENDIISALK